MLSGVQTFGDDVSLFWRGVGLGWIRHAELRGDFPDLKLGGLGLGDAPLPQRLVDRDERCEPRAGEWALRLWWLRLLRR